MKKYIIKNADGSAQNVMPAIHNTYKSALQTLLSHLIMAAGGMNDDCTESPFKYIIEEVGEKDVNERITDFKSACLALGRKSNNPLRVAMTKETSSKSDLSFDGISRLVEEINPRHLEALIALNKLFTIAQAWNKEDGFVPDFSDWEQDKWFPWFVYDKDAAGFVFANTNNAPTYANALFGSRLCFKSSARAAQFGKQFIDLYNKVFL